MSDWEPSRFALEEAATMTPLMRSSPNPPWPEVRERLASAGVTPDESVLTLWVTEGDANMGATVATRDGRVFDVMVVMGYDRENQRVSKDEGFVTSFREVPPEGVTVIPSGIPNGWLQARLTARAFLAAESEA